MPAPATLHTLDSLPRTPASDVKKLGWRGVMRAVTRNGRVLVTNHDEPEAVILPVAEYAAILDLLHDKAARDEAVLDELRRRFDQRLACLKAPDAGEKLESIFDKPFSFEGKIFTGNDY